MTFASLDEAISGMMKDAADDRERRGAGGNGLCVLPVFAHTVILESGRLHLRGQLVNGACTVATDSQNLRVQMGSIAPMLSPGRGALPLPACRFHCA
jgi:hypothetical protein